LQQKTRKIHDASERGAEMMPLTMARNGERVMIRKITGKDEVRQHLAELGFVVDGEVTIISEISGNLILQVKDSRIAVDKSMANRIMI
jgi:ferrous iron transport protein A